MKTRVKNHQAGFTLIEFIVALVIAGIVAAMVYTYFGSALTQSSVPIERLKQVSNLNQVMENIVADYNRLNQINLRYKWLSNTDYKINQIVQPSDSTTNSSSKLNNNGRYYICTQSGRSDAANLPAWTVTTPPGTEFTDGGVKWKEYGYVWKANMTYPANALIVPAITNGHFYMGNGTTSGSTDPKTVGGGWPKTEGGTVSDGSITWTEVGSILYRNNPNDTSIENIWTYLNTSDLQGKGRYDNNQNSYEVVFTGTNKTGFVKVNSTTNAIEEATGTEEKNILRVTIKSNDTAETLTQLFTIQ